MIMLLLFICSKLKIVIVAGVRLFSLTGRSKDMIRKQVHYPNSNIYAIVYHQENIIYYNINFTGNTQIIILL